MYLTISHGFACVYYRPMEISAKKRVPVLRNAMVPKEKVNDLSKSIYYCIQVTLLLFGHISALIYHFFTYYARPTFTEEGVYCFAHVGPSVGWSVDKPCAINY